MTGVLVEARELVSEGRLDPEQFRAFTCDNPIRLHATMNPAFFEGTTVQRYARDLIGGDRGKQI